MELHHASPVVMMAGGRGRRIGGHKASRLLGGVSLLEHMTRIASLYSNDIAIAVNGDFDTSVATNIPMIVDENDGAGPISGLLSALNFANSKGSGHVLILSCDTPFLPFDLMTKLHASIGDAGAAVAQYDGDLHPACSLWRADTVQFLPAYIGQGHRSLIGFAEAVGYIPVEWPAAPFDPFFNINTAEDLAKAGQMLAKI